MTLEELKEASVNWGTHSWSGWPGAFCLGCHTGDPMEQAIADGDYDCDEEGMLETIRYKCDPCPNPVMWSAPAGLHVGVID